MTKENVEKVCAVGTGIWLGTDSKTGEPKFIAPEVCKLAEGHDGWHKGPTTTWRGTVDDS